MIENTTGKIPPVAGIIHINEGLDLDHLNFEEDHGIRFPDMDTGGNGSMVLLGGWIKEDDGKYYHDTNSEYSAIFDAEDGYITVTHSETIKMCNRTSPCYTMKDGRRCGNLAEPDKMGIEAYDLPEEFYEREISTK